MDAVFVQHRPEIERLCRDFHVQRLELFGSDTTDQVAGFAKA